MSDAPARRRGLEFGGVLMPAAVAAVVRIALIVAALALTGTTVVTQGDTSSYLAPMMGLLRGVYGTQVVPGVWVPELDRTPGFPVFLLLTGVSRGSVLFYLFCQTVVSLLSLLLVARIARRLFANEAAGSLAAWCFALEPLSIVSCARVMPETLFVLLMLCVVDRLTAYLEEGRLGAVAWAGVALAAATFVRPVSYFLVWPLALGLIVVAGREATSGAETPIGSALIIAGEKSPAYRKRFARRMIAAGLLILCTVPWLAMWRLRNYAEVGFSGFSSIVEKNLYFYQTAELRAELAGISLEDEQRLLGYPGDADYFARHPEQKDWPLARRLGYMRDQSLGVLRANRALYLKTHLRGMAVVAFSPGATEFLQLIAAYPDTREMPRRVVNEGLFASGLRLLRTHPRIAGAMALFAVPLALVYIAAAFGGLRARLPMVLLVGGVGLYFLGISGGAQAVARYRLPVMPELCILAGGLAAGASRKPSRLV